MSMGLLLEGEVLSGNSNILWTKKGIMIKSTTALLFSIFLVGSISGQAAITGTIRTFTGLPVKNVHISLRDSVGHLLGEALSQDGNFDMSVAEGGDYTLIFDKNDNVLNGVSVFDLVLIAKHILGIDPVTNFYYFYAMDVNASNSISTIDIIYIRRLVLSVVHEFPAGSWNFVEELSDPEMPFNEVIHLNSIPVNVQLGETKTVSVIGIKMGDVNGSTTGE